MTDLDRTMLVDSLTGQTLGGVLFMRDYVQLSLDDGYILTVLVPMSVENAQGVSSFGDPVFADMLVRQIDKPIERVEFLEEHSLKLVFGDTSSLSISLKPDDYRGPEALNLSNCRGAMLLVL